MWQLIRKFRNQLYDRLFDNVYQIKLKYGLIKSNGLQFQQNANISKKPIIWPIFQDSNNKDLIEHFFSFITDYNGYQKNTKNILFCIGSTQSGKSWFLKKNNHNAIELNLEKFNCYNNFIHSIHQNLHSNLTQYELPIEILFEVLEQNYHPKYIDLYFNQILKQMQENTWLHQLSTSQQEEIIKLLHNQKENEINALLGLEEDQIYQIQDFSNDELIEIKEQVQTTIFKTNTLIKDIAMIVKNDESEYSTILKIIYSILNEIEIRDERQV